MTKTPKQPQPHPDILIHHHTSSTSHGFTPAVLGAIGHRRRPLRQATAPAPHGRCGARGAPGAPVGRPEAFGDERTASSLKRTACVCLPFVISFEGQRRPRRPKHAGIFSAAKRCQSQSSLDVWRGIGRALKRTQSRLTQVAPKAQEEDP